MWGFAEAQVSMVQIPIFAGLVGFGATKLHGSEWNFYRKVPPPARGSGRKVPPANVSSPM